MPRSDHPLASGVLALAAALLTPLALAAPVTYEIDRKSVV